MSALQAERKTTMQRCFAEREYVAKEKVKLRDRFLGESNAVTPWSALMAQVEPFYPKGEGRGRLPIGLERMLRMIFLSKRLIGRGHLHKFIYSLYPPEIFKAIDTTNAMKSLNSVIGYATKRRQ